MDKSYVKNNPKSQYHYFGERLLVRNGMFDYVQLNPLQEMLVLLADGSHTKEELYQIILKNFRIEDTEKNKELYGTLLGHLVEKEIIIFHENKAESKLKISGERGKPYPDWIMIEATNKCNFRCPHCYKNANIGGKELSVNKFERIVNAMKQKATNMIITGGEPCCNSGIEQFLTLAGQNFNTYLLTNGYYLSDIRMDVIASLKGVQISLYGYDENGYYRFTGVKDAYGKVFHTLSKLADNHVDVSLTTIVTRDNLGELEYYVKKAIEMGAATMMFGISAPLGRLQPNNKQFIFDSEIHKMIREKVLELREKYKNKIDIVRMGDITSFTPVLGEDFQCQAGKLTIVITEEGEVVPCHMATRSIFQGYSFDSYLQDVEEGKTKDYTEQVRQFRQYMEERGAKTQDLYCTGFCDIPN